MHYWRPQIGPQSAAIDTALFCEELLFGGARGGGKTDFLLADFIADVEHGYGSGWRGIIFRKSYPECEELIARSHEIYPLCFKGAEFMQSKKTWHFPDGATLKIRSLENDYDADKFQGHSYTWIGWDELGNWASPHAYHRLKACLRSAKSITGKRIRATANPGGVGHHWVKSYFGIGQYPIGNSLIREAETKSTRMFIKSKVFDNRILLERDPDYIDRLSRVGSRDLVRAWLDGNWDVVTGAFFPEWDQNKHIIDPFHLPAHWTRFLSFDWGSSSPFSAGWWAVASEDHVLSNKQIIPRGSLIRYREWYGADNQGYGLKLNAECVADRIKKHMLSSEKLSYAVADPSIFRVDGGPSIAERMARKNLIFRPADNARIAGWDQLRARLLGDGARPMIYCFHTCVNSIRTIPALVHARNMAEDVDTNAEDHAADEWRYACMSRPYIGKPPKILNVNSEHNSITLNDLFEFDQKPKANAIFRI